MKYFLSLSYIKVLVLIAFAINRVLSVTSTTSALTSDQSLNISTETATLLTLSTDVNQIDKNNTIPAIDRNQSIGQTTEWTPTSPMNSEFQTKFYDLETISSVIEDINSTESPESHLKGFSEDSITSTDSSQISTIDSKNASNISDNRVTETSITSTSTTKTNENITKNEDIIESTDSDNNWNNSLNSSLNPETTTWAQLSETTLASTLISIQDNSNKSNYRFTSSENVLQTTSTFSTPLPTTTEPLPQDITSKTIFQNTTESTFETTFQPISDTTFATLPTILLTNSSISSIPDYSFRAESTSGTTTKSIPNLSSESSYLNVSNDSNRNLTEEQLNHKNMSETLDLMLTTTQTMTETSLLVRTNVSVNDNSTDNVLNTQIVNKKWEFEKSTISSEANDDSIENLNQVLGFTSISADMPTTTTSTTTTTTTISSKKKTLNETTEVSGSAFRVMCTIGGWATHRRGLGRFDVRDLERADFVLSRCSHLIYAFASLSSDGTVLTFDSFRELNPKYGTFAKLAAIKKKYPHLKTLVAVGGWDTPADIFSFLVSDSTKRQTVAQRVTQFIKQYSFDGTVISWFYPGVQWRSGQSSDKSNLVLFLKELKSQLKHDKLELGIMAPAVQQHIDSGFDVPNVSKLVDHLLIMSYDYFGSWDQTVNHFSPLYQINNTLKQLNVDFTLNYWLSKGAIREKTIIGLATYGRTFTLTDSRHYKFNAPALGPGIPGPYTNRPGIIGFNEICEIYLSTAGVKLEEDEHRVGPYLHLYDQWVGFEDELSLFIKTQYAMNERLKGVFLWTLDLDDFTNKCGWGHFPLLKATLQAVYKTKHIH